MKFTIVCALVAAVQTIVTPGDTTDTKNSKVAAAPSPYDCTPDMDVSKDAAYYNHIVGGPSHSTGNYTYSIKPNEYMGWNDGSYTYNYKTTGDHFGDNRDTEHYIPAYELGKDTTVKEGGANHPKTEYGTEHKGYNHTASPIAHTDTYPIWQ